MRTTKILLIDVGFAAFFLLLAAFMVTAVKIIFGSQCTSCGASAGINLWLIFVFALQPAIWSKNISAWKQSLIWLISTAISIVIYLVLENIAGYMLFNMGLSSGISLGVMANVVSVLSAYFLSLRGVKNIQNKKTYAPLNPP